MQRTRSTGAAWQGLWSIRARRRSLSTLSGPQSLPPVAADPWLCPVTPCLLRAAFDSASVAHTTRPCATRGNSRNSATPPQTSDGGIASMERLRLRRCQGCGCRAPDRAPILCGCSWALPRMLRLRRCQGCCGCNARPCAVSAPCRPRSAPEHFRAPLSCAVLPSPAAPSSEMVLSPRSAPASVFTKICIPPGSSARPGRGGCPRCSGYWA